jgi:hypothetical protein
MNLKIPIKAEPLKTCIGDVETFFKSPESCVFINMDAKVLVEKIGADRMLSMLPYDAVSEFVRKAEEPSDDDETGQPDRKTHTRQPHNEQKPLSSATIEELKNNPLLKEWLFKKDDKIELCPVGRDDLFYIWTPKELFKTEMHTIGTTENIIRCLGFVRWCFRNNIKVPNYKDTYWGFNTNTRGLVCLYHFFEGLGTGEEVYLKIFERMAKCTKRLACYNTFQSWLREDDIKTTPLYEFLTEGSTMHPGEFYEKYARKKQDKKLLQTRKRAPHVIEEEEEAPKEPKVMIEQFDLDAYFPTPPLSLPPTEDPTPPPPTIETDPGPNE